jgi:hypothetical protein
MVSSVPVNDESKAWSGGIFMATYPAFLDGQTKRMLIGHHWVDSASGKTFDSINPATDSVG